MFDFDGTLVDSLEIYHQVHRDFGKRWGIPLFETQSQFLELFENNFHDALERAGYPREQWRAKLPQLNAVLKAKTPHLHFFPEIKRVLKQLASKEPVYVVTSNFSSVVEQLFELHTVSGIEDILGVEKETSKVRKIESVINRHPGMQPLYVGDTVGDMVEGDQAGALTVGVSWGWHGHHQLEAAGADFVVSKPRELLLL